MRIGTPGFVPGRLIEAREARGLSQTAVSERTGIKSQSISHYEQGRQSPSPEALALLCEGLQLPERFFLRGLRRAVERRIFFRPVTASVKAKTARLKAERRLGWLEEITRYVGRFVDLPENRMHCFPLEAEAGECGAEIEEFASSLRAHLGLGEGPLLNLTGVLETNGVVMARAPLEAELSGSCSCREALFSLVVLSSEESRLGWTRLHAAHELGHLVMHSHLPPADLADPAKADMLAQQAERFARAFLMPAKAFGGEVWAPTIDALLSLKKDWRCPVSAMIQRCGEIGLMEADQVRRSALNLVRRGWKISEPRESSIETETPGLLARGLQMIVDGGLRDAHSILADTGLDAGDIEQLSGLPPGWFSTGPSPRPIPLRLRRESAEQATTGD